MNKEARMAPNIGPYVGGYAGEFAVEKLYPGGYDVWRAMRRGNGKIYFGWIFNSLREFSPEIKRALGGK